MVYVLSAVRTMLFRDILSAANVHIRITNELSADTADRPKNRSRHTMHIYEN